MKLTGILKNKVDKAETMAEKKDLIAEAGMELNDNELEMVTGGVSLPGGVSLSDDCYLSMLFIN